MSPGIAITIDNNYLQHACVMLQSLKANITSDVNVYCIYDHLDANNKAIIENHFKGSRLKLKFLEFDKKVLPDLPIKDNDHVTSAAFFRIWLPSILDEVDQILFLDSDIIINGDISPLFRLTIADYALAAVPDLGMSNEKKLGLGIAPDQFYFNSGVMLLNLKYFRQHNLTTQITRFIQSKPELCEFWDQDAFNAVLKGAFYKLDYKYNVQSVFFERLSNNPGLRDALEKPVVIHYTGGGDCKPWRYHNTHPLNRLYYKYLLRTPFRFYYPPEMPRSWHIFRRLKLMFLK